MYIEGKQEQKIITNYSKTDFYIKKKQNCILPLPLIQIRKAYGNF